MNDLTERALEVVRVALARYCFDDDDLATTAGELAVDALDAAGMLTDPDAEDPRITAARGLVQAWTDQSDRALEHKAALEHRPWTESSHAALLCEARTASDHASELRLVLDGDTPGGAS